MTLASMWRTVPLFSMSYCGLNKKYDHDNMYLKWVQLFPSYQDVHNDLLLEELTLDVEASSGSTMALTASGE
jgi:hypothetical protein